MFEEQPGSQCSGREVGGKFQRGNGPGVQMARFLSFDGDEMGVIEGISTGGMARLKRITVAVMLGRDSGEMFQVMCPGEESVGCKFVCWLFVGEDAP